MSRHHAPSPARNAAHRRRPELSQHFLRDPRLARSIVAELRAPFGSLVLDAGAGRGALTEALAEAGFRVIAVEKDVRLFQSLRSRFIGRTNVECHHADVLACGWPPAPHAVVSNVPYAITAAFVRRILASAATDAVLILQREAARKFAGAPRESVFSLLYKPWFEIAMVRDLRRADFDPPPSVESVVLRVHRRATPLLPSRERDAWCAFVRAGFGAATVRDVLRHACGWHETARLERELGFSRHWRPSRLTFDQWLALFRSQRSRRSCSIKRVPRSAFAAVRFARRMTNERPTITGTGRAPAGGSAPRSTRRRRAGS